MSRNSANNPQAEAPALAHWKVRAGWTAERVVRVFFFVAGCEAGILWRFSQSGAGPKGIVSLALWSPVILLFAIALAWLGASAGLNLAGAAGLCGTVSIRDGRLVLPRGGSFTIRGGLRLDGRRHTAQVERSLRLPFMDKTYPMPFSKKAQPQRIFTAVAQFEQDGREAALYAFKASRKKDMAPPQGLDLPDTPTLRTRGIRLRLSPADLADLVAKVKAIGGEDLKAYAAESPETARKRAGLDPRTLFLSRGAAVAASILIIGLAVLPPALKIRAWAPGADAVSEATGISAEVAAKIKGLKSSETLWKRTAAGELGLMGREAAPTLEILKKLAAEDADADVRETAARAVGRIEAVLKEPPPVR